MRLLRCTAGALLSVRRLKRLLRTWDRFLSPRHIPGAVSAPLEELSARAKAGTLGGPTTPLAVVCAGGTRSAQAAVRLRRVLGFADVTSVRGGTAAWAALGLPLQT